MTRADARCLAAGARWRSAAPGLLPLRAAAQRRADLGRHAARRCARRLRWSRRDAHLRPARARRRALRAGVRAGAGHRTQPRDALHRPGRRSATACCATASRCRRRATRSRRSSAPPADTTAGFVSSFVLDPRFGWNQGFEHFDAVLPEAGATMGKSEAVPRRLLGRASASTASTAARSRRSTRRSRWLDEAPEPFFVFVHYFDPHAPYVPPTVLAAARCELPRAARRSRACPASRPTQLETSDPALPRRGALRRRRTGCAARRRRAPHRRLGARRRDCGPRRRARPARLARARRPSLRRADPGAPAAALARRGADGTPRRDAGGARRRRAHHPRAGRASTPGEPRDGRSLAGALATAPSRPRARSSAIRRLVEDTRAGTTASSSRCATARWKYIFASESPHELYDLAADPGERRNVLAEHPESRSRAARAARIARRRRCRSCTTRRRSPRKRATRCKRSDTWNSRETQHDRTSPDPHPRRRRRCCVSAFFTLPDLALPRARRGHRLAATTAASSTPTLIAVGTGGANENPIAARPGDSGRRRLARSARRRRSPRRRGTAPLPDSRGTTGYGAADEPAAREHRRSRRPAPHRLEHAAHETAAPAGTTRHARAGRRDRGGLCAQHRRPRRQARGSLPTAHDSRSSRSAMRSARSVTASR